MSNRKQRAKVNNILLYGIPQGSTLGPLLFGILPYDLVYFLEGTDIANYAEIPHLTMLWKLKKNMFKKSFEIHRSLSLNVSLKLYESD